METCSFTSVLTGSAPSSSQASSAATSATIMNSAAAAAASSSNNNNNNVTKRSYPFERRFLFHEPKVPKICEKSFLPALEKVFGGDSKVQLNKVRHGTRPGDNFTSIIYAIEAIVTKTEGADGEELRNQPPKLLHLVMKCFPNHPARQDFFRKIDIFRKELDVYRYVLPELRWFEKERFEKRAAEQQEGAEPRTSLLSAFPRFYGGAYGDDFNRYWEDCGSSLIAHGNFILMEDVRKTLGYKMPSKFGLDLAHCNLVVREIAKLHALSMAYIKLSLENSSSLVDRFDCLKETVLTSQTENIIGPLFDSSFSTSVQIVHQQTGTDSIYSEKMRRFGNRVHWIFGHILAGHGDKMTLLEMLETKPDFEDLHDQNKDRKRNSGWFVLTHGDLYFNNMLFKYHPQTRQPVAVKLVDLQLARENCLTLDLVHFIYLSTTPEFRRENLDSLLETYYNSFIHTCNLLKVDPYPDFTMANLMDKFHKAKVLGMINSLFVLPVVLTSADDVEEGGGGGGAGQGKEDLLKEVVAAQSSSQVLHQLLLREERRASAKHEKLYTRVVQLVQEMSDQGVI